MATHDRSRVYAGGVVRIAIAARYVPDWEQRQERYRERWMATASLHGHVLHTEGVEKRRRGRRRGGAGQAAVSGVDCSRRRLVRLVAAGADAQNGPCDDKGDNVATAANAEANADVGATDGADAANDDADAEIVRSAPPCRLFDTTTSTNYAATAAGAAVDSGDGGGRATTAGAPSAPASASESDRAMAVDATRLGWLLHLIRHVAVCQLRAPSRSDSQRLLPPTAAT